MSTEVRNPTLRTVVLADGRGEPGGHDEPTRRVLTRMAVGTLVVLATLVVAGYFAGVRLAERQVLANSRSLNEAVAHALVEPAGDRLRAGDAQALAALDDAVRGHLLPETPVEHVKLWTPEGRIIYSDERELIGRTFPLAHDQLELVRSGGSSTDVSDLAEDENRVERAEGLSHLFEVYSAVPTDTGRNLLFETYVRYDVLQQRQRDVLRSFAWIGLLGLGLFATSQLWLTSANLRWLQRERARLATRSAEAVEEQRRRVARDLHDGVVQDLIGAAYLVSGGAGTLRSAGRPASAEALHEAEQSIRASIRSLRSLLIDLYPANLRTAGLRAALMDLVAPIQHRGTEVRLELPEELDLPDHLEAALYRAAREAVHNAAYTGRAAELSVRITVDAEQAELTVVDDGTGFDPAQPAADGHLGLRGLADEAEVLGGLLEVTSAPGEGTTLRLVLPR